MTKLCPHTTMNTNRTYKGSMSKEQLIDLIRYGDTTIQVGESTYVDVRFGLDDHEDMKEAAEEITETTLGLMWEAGLIQERERDNE